MPTAVPAASPLAFTAFGDLLKYLRRRARLTQRDLGIAVGYSETQITKLEKSQRLPDLTTLAALFVPALQLDDDPAWVARLLELAAEARHERLPRSLTFSHRTEDTSAEELGVLEGIPAPPAYLVERSHALARLRDRLALDGRVALCGLAGMGKTTLGASLARERVGASPVFWMTFAPGGTGAVDGLLRQLALFLTSLGRGAQLQPLLRRDAGVTPLPLDERLALVTAALARQPALLCFDDVQWALADEALLPALRQLAATANISLLLLSRERLLLPGVATEQLAGLEPDEGSALVMRLGGDLTPALVERLVAKTGGSPMLLRLAVGQLRDSGAGPAEFVNRLETQPQVAAYLLDTVLGSLGPAARRLAALLSVFRRPADLYDETLIELAQAADGPYDHAAAVGELHRLHVVEEPARAQLHRLLRDHIYAALAPEPPRRRRLHLAAAEWSERVASDGLEAAYHYSLAGKQQQAIEVLAEQVQGLINQGQALEAVEVVDEILARARASARPRTGAASGEQAEFVRQLLMARGDLLINTLRADEAELNYREALALATQPMPRAQLAARLAQSRLQRSQVNEALELCREAASALAPAGGEAGPRSPYALLLAQLAAVECQAELMLSHHDEAARIASQALRLIDPMSGLTLALTAPIEAQARNTLGIVANIRGQRQAALDQWERSIAAARLGGLQRLEYRCRMNIGILLYQQHDVAGSLQSLTEALAGVQRLGDGYLAARILHNLAFIQHLRGELPAALEAIAEAAAIKRRMGDRQGLVGSENQRAVVLLALGRLAEAQAVVEQVLLEVDSGSDRRMQGGFLDTLAELQLLQRDPPAAEATLRRALELPGAADDVKLLSDLHNHLALAQLAGGDLAAAQATFERGTGQGGPEVALERQLIGAMLALLGGDAAGAASQAAAAAGQAQAIGYGLYVRAAERVSAAAAGATPALLEFPRLLWG